jgi:hypothetical protein
LLKKSLVEVLQPGNAVQVVDGNPRQPGGRNQSVEYLRQ